MPSKTSIYRFRNFLLCLIIFIFFLGCDEMKTAINNENVSEINITKECIQSINAHHILFAHMSVGNDILSGVSLANNKLTEPIAIHNIEPASQLHAPKTGISHFKIGANAQPLQKLSNFRRFLLANNNGASFDYIGIKFCYVDITNKTDIHTLLNEYEALVKDISTHYPHIKFLHFTVPLTTQYGSLKGRIKTLILGDQNNINRNKYNELLCKKFGNQTIIDIARIESSYPDGSRLEHSYFHTKYYSLIPEYTTDGGHLNDIGKHKISAAFVEDICKALSY